MPNQKIVEWPETSPESLNAMRFYLTPDPERKRFVAFCPSRPFILDADDPRCNSPEIETIQDFSEEAGRKQLQEKPAFRIFRFYSEEGGTIEEICVLTETGSSLEEISRAYDLPIIHRIGIPGES